MSIKNLLVACGGNGGSLKQVGSFSREDGVFSIWSGPRLHCSRFALFSICIARGLRLGSWMSAVERRFFHCFLLRARGYVLQSRLDSDFGVAEVKRKE